jgi:hypothetical protein
MPPDTTLLTLPSSYKACSAFTRVAACTLALSPIPPSGPARLSFIGPCRPVIYWGRQAFDCWGRTLASMAGQQGARKPGTTDGRGVTRLSPVGFLRAEAAA